MDSGNKCLIFVPKSKELTPKWVSFSAENLVQGKFLSLNKRKIGFSGQNLSFL